MPARIPRRFRSSLTSLFCAGLICASSSGLQAGPPCGYGHSSNSGCNTCGDGLSVGGPSGASKMGGAMGDSTGAGAGEQQFPSSDLNIDETFAAFTGSDFAVSDMANDGGGYIDYAVVGNFIRFRGDAAYNNPVPDRAEFFYGQCGCFGGDAPGPPLPETGVDYQEISGYLELLLTDRLSGFVEAPIRFINPEVNDNHAGISDLITGFKYALIACPDEYLTFQFKVYTPTGDANAGLGTGHVSLEPGVLYYRRWSDRLTLFGEVRDWIPISDSEDIDTSSPFFGQNWAGNIVRYGAGFGYDLFNCTSRCDSERLTLVTEFVGWSILDGLGSTATETFDATGDTIVNGKFGARYSLNGHSFYAGYGHALTGDTWYQDIGRLEYRYAF